MKEIISTFAVGDNTCQLVTSCQENEMCVSQLIHPYQDGSFVKSLYRTWYWGVSNLEVAHAAAIKFFSLNQG